MNDIWKTIQKKTPEICYCQDLLVNQERIEFIIDEAVNHVAIISEITGKPEQEITDELNNLLFSNNTKLIDFTISWLKEMQHTQLDEEELIAYLADIGMSEEEFHRYSEDSNYDISFFFEILIYCFIIKSNSKHLTAYLSNTTYLNSSNTEERACLIIELYNEFF